MEFQEVSSLLPKDLEGEGHEIIEHDDYFLDGETQSG